MKYNADRLMEHEAHFEKNGRWYLARPLPFYGWWGLRMRISEALDVLRGKADALYWEEES